MRARRTLTAGTLLGIGMGGFADGIVFHQIFQWHNMLSERLPPTTVVDLEINMFWDGLFHALCWLAVALGLSFLWTAMSRAGERLSTRAFVGSLVLGWGLFNFIEGLVNHHLLGLHHVHHGEHQLVADLIFLASGLAMVGLGIWLIRRPTSGQAKRAPPPRSV